MDGRVVVPSPMLLSAGRELINLGVPLLQILDLVEIFFSRSSSSPTNS